MVTSSAAQGGGGSFRKRKPIGEVGCCESGMAERSHWWTERCLRSPLFVSLSLFFSLFLYLSLIIYLSTYWSICLPIYLSVCLSLPCNELRMLRRHRAVRKDKHVGACRQKRQTRCCATNFRCLYAIMPSEKTNTLACNELRMLLRHRAVRKDKHEKAGPKATYQGRRTKSGQTMCLYCLMQVQCLSPQTPASVAMLPRKMLPRAFSTVHRHNQASDATATAK